MRPFWKINNKELKTSHQKATGDLTKVSITKLLLEVYLNNSYLCFPTSYHGVQENRLLHQSKFVIGQYLAADVPNHLSGSSDRKYFNIVTVVPLSRYYVLTCYLFFLALWVQACSIGLKYFCFSDLCLDQDTSGNIEELSSIQFSLFYAQPS